MDSKEQELIDKIKSQVNEVLEAKTNEQKTAFEKLSNELTEIKASKNTSDELKAELANIAAELKALKETPVKSADANTFASALYKGFEEIVKENGIDNIKKKGFNASLTVKAAATMTTANVDAVGSSSIPYTLADFSGGLIRTKRRRTFITDLCNVGATSKMYVQWAEMANNDPGTAGSTAEGAAKTQEDFDVNEKSAKVEKVTAYTKVSVEMLDDADFMKAEIENNLMELVELKFDQQVLAGTGTTPQMTGVVTAATTYSEGSFADTIDNANQFDALQTAIAQVEAANYVPNYIVLHPTDISKMLLIKDTTFNYAKPALIQIADGGITFGGIPVIKNTGLTAGKFLVGDFSQVNVRLRKDATISMGYDSDDFTKNLITILAEMRGVCYLPSNRALAVVYGDFATAIAALETP